MKTILFALIPSFMVCMLILRFNDLHKKISSDFDLSGPQKIHSSAVPRIGGISIIIGVALAIFIWIPSANNSNIFITLLLCALPTFTIGLTEDLTKSISIRLRFFFALVSALLFIFTLDCYISSTDIGWVDLSFKFIPIAIVFTMIAIAGLINAYNIIDGLNGLCSMTGIISLVALGYAGYLYKDAVIMLLTLTMTGAILGFFVWNYPKAHIFLGDGGAYLIGFWVATTSILLITRNNTISPWFALLANAYPVTETLFSIFRRVIHQKKHLGHPDALHLHSIIYRRVLRKDGAGLIFNANSKSTPYLWLMSLLPTVPSLFILESTKLLCIWLFVYLSSYIYLYRSIVLFKTPRIFQLLRF